MSVPAPSILTHTRMCLSLLFFLRSYRKWLNFRAIKRRHKKCGSCWNAFMRSFGCIGVWGLSQGYSHSSRYLVLCLSSGLKLVLP